MKFIDDLKYQLHILEAMSFGRAEGLKEVNAKLNPIIDHLSKIAMYSYQKDRDEQVKHWQGEILEWLAQIDFKCNNLKKDNKLKFKDYMLCLQDDLGRASRVRARWTRYRLRYDNKVKQPTDYEALRQQLWAILEAQFKAMSVDMWEIETLTENADYILLKQNGGVKCLNSQTDTT